MWHRLLLFLRIRDEFDWAAPGLGPEVNHPYFECATRRCCDHCGGGKLHAIHSKPYNERRAEEVYKIEAEKLGDQRLAFFHAVAHRMASNGGMGGDPDKVDAFQASGGTQSDPWLP
jgi:hypothetical protein